MYIKANIGGKDRGLKFNQMSLEIFSANIDMSAPKASSIYATFYAGLVGNCYAKRDEPDFTFEDVVNWVDELYEKDKKTIEKVCNAWEETNDFNAAKGQRQRRDRPITSSVLASSLCTALRAAAGRCRRMFFSIASCSACARR